MAADHLLNAVDFAAKLSPVAALVSAGAAVYGAVMNRRAIRAAREDARRARDEAQTSKELQARIDAAGRWHETQAGREVCNLVTNHDGRIGLIEERLIHTATKSDVDRLSGQIAGVERAVHAAAAGVDRIEGYFLETSIKGRVG